MHKEVSLYVPCRNSAGYVRSCLESVFSQTYPIREVLVIDDGSTDNTLHVLSDFKVEPIRYETNIGITAVRNAALSMASGDFIAGVDSDVVLDNGWLQRIMPHFSSAVVGGVGGRIVETNRQTLVGKWNLARRNPERGGPQDNMVRGLPDASMVYRKRVLEEIGGYNDDKRYSYPDMDASARTRMMGYRLVYEPAATSYHHFRGDFLSAFDGRWNFRKDGFINAGVFKNTHGLRRKVYLNLTDFFQFLMEDMREGRSDLSYFSLIGALRYSLLDVRLFTKIHAQDNHRHFWQTFLAFSEGVRFLIEEKAEISPAAKERTFSHLADAQIVEVEGSDSESIRRSLVAAFRDGEYQLPQKIRGLLPRVEMAFVAGSLGDIVAFVNGIPAEVWSCINESSEKVDEENNCLKHPPISS